MAPSFAGAYVRRGPFRPRRPTLSLTLYEASVPFYLRMLGNLAACLEKAEAHAKAEGKSLSSLAEARLAPDMYPLIGQIQMATDAAKGGGARLAEMTPPSFADTETTFPELHARLAKAIAFLETIKPDQVNGGEDRTIELKFPNRVMTFTGRDFLFQFSLPNFMFHVVTAYAILRSQGAPLGKMDFLAGSDAKVAA
jgi:hypothetical protein